MSSTERGQSTVELALCLPVVALLVVMVVRVGAVTIDHARLWHAAREAARVAAVDENFDAIREAAERVGPAPLRIAVSPESADRSRGSPVTVRLTHRPVEEIPLVGRFLDLTLRSEATFQIESP